MFTRVEQLVVVLTNQLPANRKANHMGEVGIGRFWFSTVDPGTRDSFQVREQVDFAR